ncbi:hypothetical protein OOK31_35470 [Streptomyces sp. NBC_00249]|uniref:hypothetical protein n=1 Tax=Streptomyces sp. NBC_00249 TaxID=2975690 RepID=UPI002255314D|nr:hypothetical protein [Streptomyces sp. NBC_00249]MCX5199128.1 hypothetical protein [Streptomyces sp. NBC_00249]
MSRPLRWVVVVGGTGIVFLVGFRLGLWDPFGWFPEKDSDRVSAAAGFGGAMAAVCALVGGWWAGEGGGGNSVRQRARASGSSRITQSGGGGGPVDQAARADGESRVRQTGGGEPDGPSE